MIVQLFKANEQPAAKTETAKNPGIYDSARGAGDVPLGHDVLERCNVLRSGVRAMLRLSVEGALDLWQGKSASRYLQEFETMLEEQRQAMRSMRGPYGLADHTLLIRNAQAALDGFAETVRREIVDGVDSRMEELAFHTALNRVKESAIRAAHCVGALQLSNS